MSRAWVKDATNVEAFSSQLAERMDELGTRAPGAVGQPWQGARKEYGGIIQNGVLTGSIRGFLNNCNKKGSLYQDADVLWEAYKKNPSSKLLSSKKFPMEERKGEFLKQLETRRRSALTGHDVQQVSHGPVQAPGAEQYQGTAAYGIKEPVPVDSAFTSHEVSSESTRPPRGSEDDPVTLKPPLPIRRKPVGAARLPGQASEKSMTNPVAYSYQSLPNETREPAFRVLVLGPGNSDQPIECHLITKMLRESPSYEALSYCWGAATPTEVITLGGFPFEARVSLTQALRSLRLPDTPRLLWIDAICINQADLDERKQQVLIMREIYERASQVLIWLGAADKMGSDAIEVLIQLAADANKKATGGQNQPSDMAQSFGDTAIETSAHQNQSTGKMHDYEKYRGDCVRYLLLRDWFSRIWTVQEVTVARKARVMWGEKMYDWEIISAGLSEGFRTDLFHTGFMGPSLEIVFQRHAALLIAKSKHDNTANTRLQTLLGSFRNRKATDPRDKIFALLGLVGHDFDMTSLPPDYRTPVPDLYIRTAVHVLSNVRDLEFLSFALSNVGSELEAQLPSWVPDWSNRKTIAVPFGQSNFNSQTNHEPHGDSSICSFYHGGNIMALQIYAYDWDVIADVSEPLDLPLVFSWDDLEKVEEIKPPERPADLDEQSFRKRMKFIGHTLGWTANATLDYFRPFAKYIKTFIEWEKFAGVIENAKRGSAQEYNKPAYMETLLAGHLPYGAETLFDEWLSSLKFVRQAVKIGLDKRNDMFTVVAAIGYMRQTWHRFPAFNQLLEHANCRRLVRTRAGHLALVPSHAQIGDAIGQVKGSKFPLVVRRRQDEDWTLIGQAYVHALAAVNSASQSTPYFPIRLQ